MMLVRGLLLLLAVVGAEAGVVKVFVVDHQTGQPLAHTNVLLQSVVPAGETTRDFSIYTDRFGACTFEKLPAGLYRVSSKKANYAEARHGQKSWRSAGLPFELKADGEFITQLRMHRLGVLTGEVVDENHVGIPGVPVYAYRFGTRLKQEGKGESDDRGGFRIPGLKPGRYVVQSGSRQVDDRGLVPTWFFQSTRATEASIVDAQMEAETRVSMLEPLLGKLLSLRISTIAPPDVTVTVWLYTDGGRKEAQFKGPGTATFDELPAGNYEVLIQTNDRPPTGAYQRINLGRDGEEVNLQLEKLSVWRVNCVTTRSGAMDTRAVQVLARRKSPPEPDFNRVPCGSIYATPGVWEVTAVAPKGWYFAGADYARRSEESYDVTIPIASGAFTNVRFSQRPADVKGSVKALTGQSAVGIPVFLIPVDTDLKIRLSFASLSGFADQDGKFWFTGIPPGRYEVVATWETAEIDVREWVVGAEKALTVEEGSMAQVEVGIREIP